MTSTLRLHQIGRERGKSIEFPVCKSPLNNNVFPLDIAKFAQTLAQRLDAGDVSGREAALDILSGEFSSAAAPGQHALSARKHSRQNSQ